MSFSDVGQQLRAYRMASGLKAEDISARLGISRAALYRYEKGEVIKLETINRLADLLNISPLALLGIGIAYYTTPLSFAERLRQIEESSDQILHFFGPLCYLLTSPQYDTGLSQILDEHVSAISTDAQVHKSATTDLMNLLLARKKTYQTRKPTMIVTLNLSSMRTFLAEGIAPSAIISTTSRRTARQLAYDELERLADLMESEPIGLQLGVMPKGEPNGPFALYRSHERALLTINPFPPDASPHAPSGVAMITNAEDAITLHQRVYEEIWPTALKGAAAAQQVRALLQEAHP